MNWLAKLNDDPLPWLLETDPANPGVRYFTLRDLLDLPADDAELREAQADVMLSGPVRAILNAQAPDGYWDKPGAGYARKYTGTVWSVIFLAMFGADGRDPAVRRGCDYVLDHSRARAPYGGFSALTELYPAGMVQCLGGNLGAALIDLGWRDDPRLGEALAWLARSITGEGIVPADEAPPRGTKSGEDEGMRYFKGGISGPGFECAANSRKPCAWGAIKAMLALSKVPESARTPTMQAAIAQGVDFLLGRDPGRGRLPHPGRPPAEPELVPAWLSARLRDGCAAKPGGAGRAGPRRRSAAGERVGLAARQARPRGPLEDGVHIQRQDVAGRRAEGPAEQMGHAAGAAGFETSSMTSLFVRQLLGRRYNPHYNRRRTGRRAMPVSRSPRQRVAPQPSRTPKHPPAGPPDAWRACARRGVQRHVGPAFVRLVGGLLRRSSAGACVLAGSRTDRARPRGLRSRHPPAPSRSPTGKPTRTTPTCCWTSWQRSS